MSRPGRGLAYRKNLTLEVSHGIIELSSIREGAKIDNNKTPNDKTPKRHGWWNTKEESR
jgi:hypothetical protein